MSKWSAKKLHRDLIFSASCVKGLYDNCLGHEIVMWLDKKCKDRQDAGLECDDSLRRFEDGAQMPFFFSKKWDTLRIPSYLRLDSEPRFLVGSIHYELPEKADREAMLSLLRQIDTLMQSMPAGEPARAVNARDAFGEIESTGSAGGCKAPRLIIAPTTYTPSPFLTRCPLSRAPTLTLAVHCPHPLPMA